MTNNYRIDGNTVIIYCTFEGEQVGTIIDLEDFELANSFPNKWYVKRSGKNHFYVAGITRVDNKQKVHYLHRLITSCPAGKVVDHINHNTLDNRRENLRAVSTQINALNSRGNRSVGRRKDITKWRARIRVNGKEFHLGYFKTEEEALQARRKAEQIYFKGFIHGDDLERRKAT